MKNSKGQNRTEAFEIHGDWKDHSKQLKIKYSQLTDEDLKLEAGKENDMLKRVETRLSKNREEVINIINKVQHSFLPL